MTEEIKKIRKSAFVGIAGGSGSGKSTLAHGLRQHLADLIEVIHLDDYQKKKEETPLLHGMHNRDHPSAVNFDQLAHDLTALSTGEEVSVMTWRQHLNPDDRQEGKVPYILQPRPLVIVEGYLTLWDGRTRDFLDYAIFLDLDDATRIQRRDKFASEDYTQKILLPMHHQYIEPTKQYADKIIDVRNCLSQTILQQAIEYLHQLELLNIKEEQP